MAQNEDALLTGDDMLKNWLEGIYNCLEGDFLKDVTKAYGPELGHVLRGLNLGNEGDVGEVNLL